jgi:hypothetical protein
MKSRVNVEDFVGYKVGSLEVIKFIEEKWVESGKRYDHYYLCRCSCGEEQVFIRRVLMSPAVKKRDTITCKKCRVTNLLGNKNGLKYQDDLDRHIAIVFSNYRSKCKSKSWSFDLSFDQFKDLVTKECWYCGLPPNNCRSDRIGDKSFSRKALSGIDRIDSDKGYLISNCRSCCEDCNLAKRRLSEDNFLSLVKRIYERHLDYE